MKKKAFILLFAVSGYFELCYGQNIAINTDGSAAETGVILDLKGTNAKAAATASQTIFQIKSNDASNELKLRLILGNDATPGARYGAIDVADFAGPSYRTLALQPVTGNVTIGTTTPLGTLTINGNIITTTTAGTGGHPGIWMNANLLGAAGGAYGILSRGTLNAVANNDEMIPFITSIGTVAPGAFTGVKFYGAKLDGSTWTKSGGTISDAYGLYVLAPTIGTNNYAAAFTGGNVGIGTTAPAARLDVVYPGATSSLAGKFLHSGSAASPGTGLAVSNGYPASSGSGSYEVFGVWGNSFGSNYVSVRDNGNVGIGTVTPGAKLQTMTSAGYSFPATSGTTPTGSQIRMSSAGGASLDFGTETTGIQWMQATNWGDLSLKYSLLLNPNGGNIGVGTTAPGWLVDAKKDQNGYTLYGIRNSTAGTGAMSGMIVYNDNAASAGIFGLTSTAWNLAGAYPTLGQNKVFIDANTSMNGIVLNTEGPQPLFFATNMTERARIDGAGNMGIGTTTPGTVPGWAQPANMRVLEVSGDASAGMYSDGALMLSNNRTTATVGDQAGAVLFAHKNNAGNFPAAISSVLTGTGGANGFGGELRFSTKPDNVLGHLQRMVIDNSGRVGIGTTGPSYRLHVYNSDPTMIINSLSDFQPGIVANQAANLHSAWNQINAGSAFHYNCGLYGAVNRINLLAGQTGTVTATYGSVNDLVHYGSGAVGQAFGSVAQISNTSTAVIANAYGQFLGIYNSGGGSISNSFGLYIANIQGTTKWSLYAADAAAPSYFAGNLGIGMAPGYQIELSTNSAGKPGSGSWTITSDSRLKNIEGSYTKGLKEILQLEPIVYHYKNSEKRKFPESVLNTAFVGFSAQEVQKIFPEAVGQTADGYLNLDMQSILIAYTNAFKEQQKLIEALTNKVNAMENALKVAGIPANSSPSGQISSEKK